MIAYINENYIEEKEAKLQVGDLAIQRGYGVFDYFRTRNYVSLFIDDYLERFFESAKGLRLQVPRTKPEIKEIVKQLIDQNEVPDSGFRMLLTGGYSADSFTATSSNFIIIQQPLIVSTKDKFEKGLKVMLHEYMRDLPTIKSINYLMGIYLQDKMQQQQADEVLYYEDEAVLEFPRSNVFIVTKDKVVVTPSANVLRGITRKKVIEVAAKSYKVEERLVTLDDLHEASEVFLTSTTKRILPVFTINNKAVGNGKVGEVTANLYQEFLEMEDAYIKPLA